MVLSFTGTLLAADAFTGTWKLNVSKSKFAAGTEVKELTAVLAEEGANLPKFEQPRSQPGGAVSSVRK